MRHVSHRGPLGEVYLRAIESLGTLRDPEAIAPLKEALYRGEWWAPRRNTVLRSAAARGARADRDAGGAGGAERSRRERAARRPHGGPRALERRAAARRASEGARRDRAARSSSPTSCSAAWPRRSAPDSCIRKGHPIIARNLEALSTAIQLLHGLEPDAS